MNALARFFRRKSVWLPIAAVGLAVAGQTVVLPMLVRGRVEAVLEAIGRQKATFRVTRATLWGSTIADIHSSDEHVDEVRISYSPGHLWRRSVDTVAIRGAHLAIDLSKASSGGESDLSQLPLNRLLVSDAQIDLKGIAVIKVDANLTRGKSGFSLAAKGEAIAPSENPADQPQLTAGVFEVSGDFNQSGLSLAVVVSAASLKFEGTELTDGTARFRIEDGAVKVEETKWRWLSGELTSRDFQIRPGQPTKATLEAKEVSLKELLATFAPGKVQGDGRLSGRLPLVISSSGVTFGEGMLSASGSGQMAVVDTELLAPAAEAAAQSVAAASQDQVKRNVIEALKDFRFEKLSAKLVQEPDGLVGYVRMMGHGATGAHQGLDYEMRVTGLDKMVRSVLRIRGILQRSEKRGAG